jgi:pimeloyl-ACP methyl ester carboxylesterase
MTFLKDIDVTVARLAGRRRRNARRLLSWALVETRKAWQVRRDPYRSVPVESRARLERFRDTHPVRRVSLNEVEWSYLLAGGCGGGGGRNCILVLPGALGTAESSWMSILRFEATHRVLCPSYPPLPTMSSLVDGLRDLLAYERIDRAHVVGASYGGLVAQALVHRYPSVVQDLVLSHTGHPDRERGAKIARALTWLDKLPMVLLRTLLLKKLSGLVPATVPDAALVRASMRDALETVVTKAHLIAAYRRVADFDQHGEGSTDGLSAWPGRILLLAADDDPGTPPPVRDRLQALYPRARLRLFHGTGHATALLQPEEYYGEIVRFLTS